VIVTDMVVVRGGLVGDTAIELRVASSETTVSFVRDHHPQFQTHYAVLKPGVTVTTGHLEGVLVGAALLQEMPERPERVGDAGIACIVVDSGRRREGIGRQLIIAATAALFDRGHRRVIAEWVAAESLYAPLGFTVLRQREVEEEAGNVERLIGGRADR
jgi:ribosomal protein S18 acetylase RimI-like enzyme